MDFEKEYKRKALEPIVNYIESVMASYSKEELEARIKNALPKKESEDERIRKELLDAVDKARVFDIDKDVADRWTAWLEKQKEQKPTNLGKPKEWSEEDKEMINLLIAIFEVNYPNGFYKANPINTTNMSGVHSSEIIYWLKSLRPQPHRNPENTIELFRPAPGTVIEKGIKEAVEKASQSGKRIVFEFNNWLKIIEPGSSEEDLLNKWHKRERHWKPSKEQINALHAFVGMIHPDARYDAVLSLLDELKAL